LAERWRPSYFAVGLAVIVAGASVLLVYGAHWYDGHVALGGDAIWYAGVAHYLAHGQGFFDPLRSEAVRHLVPSAAHPPLFPALLAVPQVLGFHGSLALRLWSAIGVAATVLLAGLLGRDLAGERAGLIAAAIAAVFVDVAGLSLTGWSEGVYGCTIALSVYAAYRFIASPDVAHALFLGVAITLAALTRAEAVLLYAILLVPLVWRARRRSPARRLVLLGAALGVAALLFAPWIAYNGGRFRHPVFVSTGLGGVLASSNCPSTYYGPVLGAWGFVCLPNVHITPGSDETVDDARMRRAGIRYASDHAGRLPVVIAARLGRTFGFYQPSIMSGSTLGFRNTEASWLTGVALVEYYVLLALGIAGFAVLVRRGIPVLPFVSVTALVVVVTVFGYGAMRFRIALEAVLPVLAAIAVDAGIRRLRPTAYDGGGEVLARDRNAPDPPSPVTVTS
jgi:4-amino-4-deoxy-L-arabinose transferase-like glycosyltransferase